MILHVDMDAFYASVEEREDPALRGKPLIVGGSSSGRGVVAAANYAARRFGVHSAMPTATALRRCPQAKVLPPRIDFYSEVSKQLREIFFRYTPMVEPLSLDEAFLDVRGCLQLFGSAIEIARQIKTDIQREVQLVASVGVAPNKYLAKLASDLEKPNGFVVVDPENVQSFLDPLPVTRIWGVGKSASKVFDALGVGTIGQLRRLSEEQLNSRFGKQGAHILELAHGRDSRAVVPDREAKSISHETTFATDVHSMEVLESWLMSLTEQVARRLRHSSLRGRTIQLKVRFEDFTTITRSQTLSTTTDATDTIWEAALQMLQNKLPDRRLSVRLLGIGVSGLGKEAPRQLEMFSESSKANSALDKVTDQIADRFGVSAIHRAMSRQRNSDDYTGTDPNGKM